MRYLSILVITLLFSACSQNNNLWELKNYTLTDTQKGTVEFLSFPSKALNADWEYGVYLPPNYDSKNSYPIIYLLHGAYGDHTDWVKQGNVYDTLNRMIASKKLAPSIVIFPNGSPNKQDSYYVNSELMNMETAMEDDLFPYIESQYSIKKERKSHSIGGLSMGGYGALRFALRNAEYFGSVFILSPAIWSTTMTPEREKMMGDKKYFGKPFDRELWKKQNYPALWDDYKNSNNKIRFFIANGVNDTVTPLELTQTLRDKLDQENEEYIYIEQDFLVHGWGAWTSILPQALEYIEIK